MSNICLRNSRTLKIIGALNCGPIWDLIHDPEVLGIPQYYLIVKIVLSPFSKNCPNGLIAAAFTSSGLQAGQQFKSGKIKCCKDKTLLPRLICVITFHYIIPMAPSANIKKFYSTKCFPLSCLIYFLITR